MRRPYIKSCCVEFLLAQSLHCNQAEPSLAWTSEYITAQQSQSHSVFFAALHKGSRANFKTSLAHFHGKDVQAWPKTLPSVLRCLASVKHLQHEADTSARQATPRSPASLMRRTTLEIDVYTWEQTVSRVFPLESHLAHLTSDPMFSSFFFRRVYRQNKKSLRLLGNCNYRADTFPRDLISPRDRIGNEEKQKG